MKINSLYSGGAACILFWMPSLSTESFAEISGQIHDLYRSARATALGGAYVAVADDDSSIFLNPAGLGGVKRYQINYNVTTLELSQGTIGVALGRSGGSIGAGNAAGLNYFIGKNIYGRAQISPTLVMNGVGLGVIVDGQAAYQARNQALPQIVLGYQQTNGIQAAYGISTSGKSARSKNDFRLGVAGKMMWRRGGYYLLPLKTLVNLSMETLRGISGSFGKGFGFDVGSQYVTWLNPKTSLSWGAAMTDIGDTKFSSGADPQRSNLSTGLALSFKVQQIEMLFSAEYGRILQELDWKKKIHFGSEFSISFLRFYAGLNQFYLTYGAHINLWILKLTALSYAEELGSAQGQEAERRYLVQLRMAFGI